MSDAIKDGNEMTDTKPSFRLRRRYLAEQIEHQIGICYAISSEYERAKLSSLEELFTIKSQPKETALQEYNRFMAQGDELSPVERLRFFLSLALKGQDWLDVEQFIDDIEVAPVTQPVPVAWMYQERDGRPFASMNPPNSFDKNELSENEVTVTPLYTHSASSQEQPVPVEPDEVTTLIEGGWSELNADATRKYIDSLQQQQMVADGWRQCAEGQGTTQYCSIAEELRKDAERYRWLRDKSEFKNERYTPRQVDADIDAAIEKMKLPSNEAPQKEIDPNKWAFDRGLESY